MDNIRIRRITVGFTAILIAVFSAFFGYHTARTAMTDEQTSVAVTQTDAPRTHTSPSQNVTPNLNAMTLPLSAHTTDPRITLVAVGDIMLSRDVASTIGRRGNDPTYPFAKMRDALRGADIAFANLETPIATGRPVPSSSMVFRSDPSTVAGLIDAGIDVVSLANNHTPNAGQQGLLDTFAYLHDAGIAYAGAGPDDAAAHAPAIITRQGIRFAFLAYNDHDVVPPSYAAGKNHAGTALMDIERMTADVKAARADAEGPEHSRGVVIISMHSGHEYTFVPDKSQTDFAHAAIDAGADLVIGHHAHVVQPVERYKDRLIFYGLGNFIFDQMWSTPTREGVMLKMTFTGTEVTDVGVIPLLIADYSQPNIADEKHAKETLARLKTELEAVGGETKMVLSEKVRK